MKKLLALLVCLWSSHSYAFPFKCDKEQNRCEVQTKRLTVGDKIGVFTSDKQLVALGEVTDIDGGQRIVKITKKWGPLLRNHDIDIIKDEFSTNPESHYTIITPLPPMVWDVQLALVNIGVGDGFFGEEVSGLFLKHFARDLSYYARLSYLTGSGKASDNLDGANAQSLKISNIGLTGGLSEMIQPSSTIAVRLDGELGVGIGNVKLGGGFNENKVLNNRFKDGAGLDARVGAAAVWRRDGLQPELGLAIVHLHSSNNAAIFIGVNGSFR